MFIYPHNSLYGDRDFICRISSATVELVKSEFTSLPDYNRILMVLKGKLILRHEGQDPIELFELEQDTFDGNVLTVSEGKVTDFNLMMRKGICQGNVEVIQIDAKSTLTKVFEEEKVHEFNVSADIYYNIKGTIAISVNESENFVLENKDLLIINRKNDKQSIIFNLNNSCEEEALLVKTKIFY